ANRPRAPDARLVLELLHRGAAEPDQPAVAAQQTLRHGFGAVFGDAGAERERDQLGVAERRRAVVGVAFAWAHRASSRDDPSRDHASEIRRWPVEVSDALTIVGRRNGPPRLPTSVRVTVVGAAGRRARAARPTRLAV